MVIGSRQKHSMSSKSLCRLLGSTAIEVATMYGKVSIYSCSRNGTKQLIE